MVQKEEFKGALLPILQLAGQSTDDLTDCKGQQAEHRLPNPKAPSNEKTLQEVLMSKEQTGRLQNTTHSSR